MNIRFLSSIAIGAALLTITGCAAPAEENSASESAVSSAQEEPQVQETADAETSMRTTATVDAGYPQEWVDRNIPAIEGLSVTGEYLTDYGQIRVVGDTIASEDVIASFGEELKSFGWTESVPGKEYVLEGETTYIVMIDVEMELSTFTVWEMKAE